MPDELPIPQTFVPQLAGNPDVWAVLVDPPESMARGVDALNLRVGRPVLVLIGGADGLDPVVGERVYALFRNHLMPLLAKLDAVVVDGGTDAGVMACAGQANAARFVTHVGVAAIGTVEVPGLGGAATGTTALEPNHSHFLLVPGDRWGDESPWLSLAASTIAGPCPSLTLVIGGGKITRLDISHSLLAGRTTILLTGSGGVADELAAHYESSAFSDALAAEWVSSAEIQTVRLDDAAEQLSRYILKILSCAI